MADGSTDPDLCDPRRRLLAAATTAMAERGYVAATVADVVAAARVSRRTFYEHFANKDECFLAAFDAYAVRLLAVPTVRREGPDGWTRRLTTGVDDLVAVLLSDPATTRLFHVEIFAAGPAGHERRMLAHRHWAKVLQREVRAARDHDPGLRAASRQPGQDIALALVGGLDQLIRAAVTDDPNWSAGRLRTAILEMIVSTGLAASPDYRLMLAERRRADRRRMARPGSDRRAGSRGTGGREAGVREAGVREAGTGAARAGARQGAD